MKPRLFLHIGHPKTGTTAIQTFLLKNRAALREEGILVPEAGLVTGVHHGLTRNWYALRNRPDRSKAEREALFREAKASGCPVIVASSEGLIQENPAGLATLFSPGFEVFILYYIRRQDLAAESIYAQRVRSYIQMAVQPPRDMLPLLIPHYGRILARWANAFGRERIRVRPFEKASFQGGGLLEDFLGLIGADPARYPGADRLRNASFKRDYLEFKRACNLLPLLEAEHHALGEALDALSAADPRPQPARLFSPEERLRLLEDCAAENAAIARDYLGCADGVLFREPPPVDAGDYRPMGLPPAEIQQAILNGLPEEVRLSLEFLDRRIRLRLPGEAFLPEIPADEAELQRRVMKRDLLRLRRRLNAAERRRAERKALPPPVISPWRKAARRLRGLLRRLTEKGRRLVG